jgi:diguanylate cyclase (GGDEF)-like protein/PAS domain S-box-containing protein
MSRRSSAATAAGLVFAGAALISYFAGWTQPAQIVEFSALLAAAMLAASLRVQGPAATDRAIMPPAFVVVFAGVMLFDLRAAASIAAAAALTPGLVTRRASPAQSLIDTAVAILAVQAAGLAHATIAALTPRLFLWPWLAVPIVGAVLAYYFTQAVLGDVLVPYVRRQGLNRSWPKHALAGYPLHLIGGGIAAVVVEIIDHRLWSMAPVLAVLLVLAYRLYGDYVDRLQEEHRRREVIDHVQQGMSVLDRDGRVTVWEDALARIVNCSSNQALGRPLVDAVPALAHTELARHIKETLEDGKPRTVGQVRLSAHADTRIVQVTVVRVAAGVALLWHDVTERARAEQELRRSGERLALAAEGANDGLWQWNLQTQEFYTSCRWRAMLGLPADAPSGGPNDWLARVHDDDRVHLTAAIEAHLAGATPVFQHEHRIRHQDGTYRRVLCRGLAVRGSGRKPIRIAGSLTDTTAHALAQEQLRSVGFLDSLTGLCNRGVFVEGIGRHFDDCRRRGITSAFAVLYLDLDRFKIVNDSLGHMVGDELLIAVSRRLETCLRQGDSLARLGGDEFAICLTALNDEAQANAIAGRIQHALSAPFTIGGREVFTSASIGIAFGPAYYANVDEIMRDADTAMYHAKSRGKSRHEVFDAAMHARVRDRLSLENDLRRAVANNDFEVHYQPIVSLTSGMCIGFESLVRWKRNGEPVSPATFVPIAEELGLIGPLGTWVLQEACRTFADWQRRFPEAGLECITVNVSSRQLVQQNFLRVVQQTLRQTGLAPASIRVEITETALLDSPGEAAVVLTALRDFGVKVYLDDFGTGYSSLSHLHKLPVDALKIDRSFVASLLLPGRPAIVESILALARTLNTSVVAEGIESEVQARELERLGCTHAQGFLFSRPLSMEAAEALIVAHRPLGPKGAAASAAAAAVTPAQPETAAYV